MNYRLLAIALVAAIQCSAVQGSETNGSSELSPRKRVLFFSKSSVWEHVVIRDPSVISRPINSSPGNMVPGLAFQVLNELGAKNNIDFVFSKDGSLFSPSYLKTFDGYFFFTTGDLTKIGVDGNPAMTPAGKQALLDAIAGGKGFVGSHCASDTFHSPGGEEIAGARFKNDGENADPYIKMLGGEFIKHGDQQQAHLIIADPGFPGIQGVPASNRTNEEWYALKNFSSDLHVILVQDTSTMTGIEYERPNYPSTWARRYGKGRVFYTSLGHRDDVWNSALFQSVLTGGLNWALGRTDADVTPNIKSFTPSADILPKHTPPDAVKPK
jgi:type 1 glutamine amidotransferase